jgi:hypothetical protein
VFYSDPVDSSGSQTDLLPYFNINLNGSTIFCDTLNPNLLVLVTSNGTIELDQLAGLFDFYTPDCSLEVQLPFSSFNSSATSNPSKRSLNKRDSSIPVVGTPVTVLLAPSDACDNPLNHLSPPTVIQMFTGAETETETEYTYTYSCSSCDPASASYVSGIAYIIGTQRRGFEPNLQSIYPLEEG